MATLRGSVALALLAIPVHARAQSVVVPGAADSARGVLAVARLTAPISLDGRSDEPAWQAIPPIVPVVAQPTFGSPPTRRTEFRFAYDDEFFYASARMWLREPGELRGNSLQRDRLGSDDVFRVILDSFNDNENGLGFATTPTGVRADFSVAYDGQSVNYDWNTFWDAAVARTDSAWFAELRIPLSSLRYQVVDGGVVMGVLAMRSSAVGNEVVTWPEAHPRFANATTRPSLARKVALRDIRSRRPLYVLPYVLGGGTTRAELDAAGDAWGTRRSNVTELGGDVKAGLTSNLTLDLTVNTDFAQAEVDDQQVNLSRFGLFFPEKRQFFLERASVFELGTGGFGDPSRLFHSRQIGLTDDGRPVGILGGARIVGRVGGWDLAALDMHTESDGSRRAENFGVLRLRRQVLNPRSTVGGIVTSRVSEGGARNHVYGTDAVLSVRDNDYVTLQWAQTFDDDRPSAGMRAGMARGVWERRSSQGLVYRLGAKWSGPDHDPALGFQQRRDFTHVDANLRYGWYFGEGTRFQSFQPSLLMYGFMRNGDGVVESAQATGFLNFGLKSGIGGNLNGSVSSEALERPLTLAPGVVVPAGRHTWAATQLSVGARPGDRFRTGYYAGTGQFYDGRRVVAGITPTATISPNLEISGEYSLQRIRFPARGQSLSADIARVRVHTALDTHLSATVFVQYNQAADAVVSNARVRVHLAEGRDLFLVYNDRLNTERGIEPAPLPLSQERTLLAKLVYAFSP